MSEWKVGDEVVKNAGAFGGYCGPFTITEVSQRKLKLSDGSEWLNSRFSRPWGSSGDRWSALSLSHIDDRIRAKMAEQERRDRARCLVKRLERDAFLLTHEQMDAIEALLK